MVCYEIISGTLPDFRWVYWKRLPPARILKDAIKSNSVNSSYTARLISPIYYNSIRKSWGMSDSTHYGVKLTIYNVTKRDQGYYSCIVSNHIGSDYVVANLTVLERARGKYKRSGAWYLDNNSKLFRPVLCQKAHS